MSVWALFTLDVVTRTMARRLQSVLESDHTDHDSSGKLTSIYGTEMTGLSYRQPSPRASITLMCKTVDLARMKSCSLDGQ